MSLLEVQHLHKRYPVDRETAAGERRGGRWRSGATPAGQSYLHAVDDVSFTLEDGESLGLVGESGCGKSTLVRLIARLIEPTAGHIAFTGQDIGAIPVRRFSRTAERGQIQVVFQDSADSLNPRFTAFDCMAEPLRRLARLESRQAIRSRVEELAKRVGLPAELLGRFPHQLSGGQQARVNIGRAIALKPRLLILDEPTSALDVSVQALILQFLDNLRRHLGLAYLFVSHDLNVVRLLCDRVLVMYLGKTVEMGSASDLFEHPWHSYTGALIAAIPGQRTRSGSRQGPLAGEPRSPIDPDPQVCRFYGRCPKGQEVCAQSQPILQSYPPDRQVACHFAEGS